MKNLTIVLLFLICPTTSVFAQQSKGLAPSQSSNGQSQLRETSPPDRSSNSQPPTAGTGVTPNLGLGNGFNGSNSGVSPAPTPSSNTVNGVGKNPVNSVDHSPQN